MSTAAERERYAELGRKQTAALSVSMRHIVEDVYTTAFGPWLDNWYASTPFETEEELHRRAREGE